jgi:hypothetical protein
MNDDAKPYASEELRLHRTAEDVRPRLRATVEALERVTKERDSEGVLARDTLIKLDFAQQVLTQLWAERDAALAACGEMRGALEAVSVLLSELRPFMTLPNASQWARLEEAHNIAAAKAKHGGGR